MKLFLSLAFISGLLLAGATSASAMLAPPAPHSSAHGIIDVRDGCGRGYHQNRHGRCVANDDDWNDRHVRSDGCDRFHHRDRWGHCARNW
ncbi:MAG TPA: hypothetical protein VNU97_07315 [Rhizomicrobium sp.]|jgi:hypothetical protein|nr:hypothetical protein [Rhizomicrobium sp.]